MLNYKELDILFEQIMSQFSKEDLENWLAFDAQREMLERLLQGGETVITFHNITVTKLVDARETFQSESLIGDAPYILAA